MKAFALKSLLLNFWLLSLRTPCILVGTYRPPAIESQVLKMFAVHSMQNKERKLMVPPLVNLNLLGVLFQAFYKQKL